jgi:dipeptidyl aminopeptidase/acylaminoacyl peptidase
VTFLNTIPEYWITWKSLWKVRTGDYTTATGLKFLEERSPLNRADRIVRPLLIAHGANDVRVKATESEQIVAAMQDHGIPVTYIIYPDEGHGLGRAETAVPSRPSRKLFFRCISADAASRSATISQAPRSSSKPAAS